MRDYIAKSGGSVVSVPGMKVLRFETLPGSPLPAKLIEYGHNVHHAGMRQRLAPNAITTQSGFVAGFETVDILELTLPGK